VSLQPIAERVASAAFTDCLRTWVDHALSTTDEEAARAALHVKGAAGSLPAFLLHQATQDADAPLLCVMPDEDAAAYLVSDLEVLFGAPSRGDASSNGQVAARTPNGQATNGQATANGTPSGDGAADAVREAPSVVRFPATGRSPYDQEQIVDSSPLIERADVLQRLTEGFRGVLVTSVEALGERVPPPESVRQDTLSVDLHQTVDLQQLTERLVGQGFERVEFVERPGQLAARGGILDVFPFSGEYPIRLEFFGDEVDSIREFDPQTQRSVSRLKTARLVPNLERGTTDAAHVPLFRYLPSPTLVATFDEARVLETAEAQYHEAAEAYEEAVVEREADTDGDPAEALPKPADRYLDRDALVDHLARHPRLLFGTFADAGPAARAGADAVETIEIGAKPQPSFNGQMDLLRERLEANRKEDIRNVILCDSHGQASRLRDLLESEIDRGMARLIVESMHEGFELRGDAADAMDGDGLAVYTDHQIFNRYHRPSTKNRQKYKGGLSLRDIKNLTPGDFVVHVDHGIGKFAGMKKITVRGKKQEAVRLNFAEDDILYVNVNALHKLNKYTGKEGHQPSLTKLGSGQWERTKARTKDKVKDIARDLIKLYAKRKASDGYAFSADTVWQQEMEASFEFEDTPDQAKAAEAVKRDMEEPVPMDRLVCGDVGFGKTEVAVRAAFKAAQDGKQVAVLVPTTILAEQHYLTFSERLERFPVQVDVISRFRTKSEQKDILKRLKDGRLDILIGTHRLTSDDVAFNDLGLLVVDEEQRFGVKTKEKLRAYREDVDTLTLTATPIPRTLQFSLLGARDLSTIETPPPNRQPIVTEIHTFDKDLIRDAIVYETSRGGQVFFIHNRVKTIHEIAEMVRSMVPGVRVKVGHGQMSGSKLENVMKGFIDKEYDVLVSTSIIENGLDISNANTMIINRADHFGLSELHQLRGRVGRSERKAFCYLLVPSIHALTDDARERLQAVEEFSDLGSGFDLAMRDLDIRGAGSLLGAEQSGFIEDVGYETYHKILDEAVQELRQDEFEDVFEGEDIAPPLPDTSVDVEEDAFIPGDYVTNNVERLNLYRRISNAEDGATLEEIRDEIADRFGPLPEPVQHLITAAEVRLRAQRMRLTKALYKNERLFLYLPTENADPYFYEHLFHPLLGALDQLDREYVLKQDTDRGLLRAIVQDVPTLAEAREIADRLMRDTTADVETRPQDAAEASDAAPAEAATDA
jgi:transcription-repair coupling factor (superfamily II helicase)